MVFHWILAFAGMTDGGMRRDDGWGCASVTSSVSDPVAGSG